MKSSYFVAAIILVAAAVVVSRAPAQNASVGKKVFEQRCHICHFPVPGRQYIGPSLFGVVGRHIGREPDYHYSKADLTTDMVFDPKTLDRYIKSPRGTVPGTAMTYIGIKDPQMRADLIAYLETLH